jgi:hypothetical protein
MLAEEAARLYACGECGTEDPSVAPGGTALCAYCAELSDLQAPALEKKLRRQDIAKVTAATALVAMLIWLLIAI